MPQAAPRNRSITFTPESQLFASSSPTVNSAKKFANKFLPQTGVAGSIANLALKNRAVTLAGVTSISIANKAIVADENGLATAFLQPWYIGNIPITLRGQSYIGAYPLLSVSDRDVERILKVFRNSLNDFTDLQGAQGTKERFLLEFSGYVQGARRFLGYISEVSWTEDVKTVNMLDYTISFIGRNVDNAAIAKGKAGNAIDKAGK